jgi:hypothetical protein
MTIVVAPEFRQGDGMAEAQVRVSPENPGQ